MAKNQQRNMEGSADQRRSAARQARSEGKRPSAMGMTTGASKGRSENPKTGNNPKHSRKKTSGH